MRRQINREVSTGLSDSVDFVTIQMKTTRDYSVEDFIFIDVKITQKHDFKTMFHQTDDTRIFLKLRNVTVERNFEHLTAELNAISGKYFSI